MKNRSFTSAFGALALAALSFAASAAAIDPNLTITTPGGVSWDVTNYGGTTAGPFSGSCDGEPGLSIADASFGGAGDAYDYAWMLYVNGVVYNAASADLTGTTLTGPVVAMSGLDVKTQYHFAPSTAVVRVLVTLANPSANPISATVQVPLNFGADGGTTFHATSSGNTTVEAGDRWIVSSDGYPSDPVLTNVFHGPGVPAETATYTTSVFDCAGSEGIGATFNLDIPAGGTQSLMFFGGLNGITSSSNTVAVAQAGAALFNSNDTLRAEWLTGLSDTQKSQIVNWASPIGNGTGSSGVATCASEGYTGTKLSWCKNICENGLTGATLDIWIHRWINRYRDLPYCAAEGGGEEEPPPQQT